MTSLNDGDEWAEEVHSVASLVRVGDELSVELLVPVEADATGGLVLGRKELLVGVVDLLDVGEGSAADTVQPVLVNTDQTVSVNINSLEVVGNEALESLGKLSVGLARAVLLDGFLELFHSYLTVLIEISEVGDLVPEVVHDGLVLGVVALIPHTTALDQGVAQGKALEVILVEVAIVVNVVHVPDHKLHTVIPGVSHFALVVSIA